MIDAFLGQIQSADPIHLRDFLIIAGFLASSGASVVAIVSAKRTQRREVSFTDEYVRKGECGLVHGSTMDRIRKLEIEMEEMRKQFRSIQDSIFSQIESMRTEVREDMRRVHERIDSMPAELITTLRNTGAIK